MVSYTYIPAASVAGGCTAAAAARTMTTAAVAGGGAAAAAGKGPPMGRIVAAVAAASSAAASADPQLMPLRNCSVPHAHAPFQRPHPRWHSRRRLVRWKNARLRLQV